VLIFSKFQLCVLNKKRCEDNQNSGMAYSRDSNILNSWQSIIGYLLFL